MPNEENTEREDRCMICGKPGAHKICDCCRECLALCDIEDLLIRKIRSEKCGAHAANAFK